MIRLSEWRTLIGQTKSGLVRLQQSNFARNAAWLLVLNLLSRGIGFFGTAYAMRSLGPVNVGISALIQTTVQQVALAFNCGFDTIALRRIAGDHGNTPVVTATAVTFRLALAAIASLIWVIACYLVIPEPQRWVWLMGALIMISSAGSIVFVFSGLEKLPIQNAIGTGGVLLMAVSYFVFFRPDMFLGADLIVIASVGLATMGVSWWVYHRLFGFWPIGRVVFGQLRLLFRESWRYWLLAVAIFFYSMFQFPLIAYLLGPRELGIFRSAFGLAAGVELLFNSINSLLLARLVNCEDGTWRDVG
jgi:O-antigen/teichoic acid export membrane protein